MTMWPLSEVRLLLIVGPTGERIHLRG